MAGRGVAYFQRRKGLLLYNVGVAGFSASSSVVAAVAVTASVDRVDGVENSNIHMHSTQVSCVGLRLRARSQP